MFKFILLLLLVFVHHGKIFELTFVFLLRLFKLVVLKLNLLLFLLYLLSLVGYLLVHALSLLFLVSLVLFHMFLQVTLQLLYIFNFNLLLFKLAFCLLQLLVFVS